MCYKGNIFCLELIALTLFSFQSNLLCDFSKLSPGRSRKSKGKQTMDLMWLELAVALSFSTDGQQMLLKNNGKNWFAQRSVSKKYFLIVCMQFCIDHFS